ATLRADARGGTPVDGPRTPGARHNPAALDARGRAVEPEAARPAAPSASGAEGAFWRARAAGRESPRLVRGARAPGVRDDDGGRRHESHPDPLQPGGDDVGRRRGAAGVDRAARPAAGALLRLEERVSAPADAERAEPWRGAAHAVRP